MKIHTPLLKYAICILNSLFLHIFRFLLLAPFKKGRYKKNKKILPLVLLYTLGIVYVQAQTVTPDNTFNIGSGFDDRVIVLSAQPDGKIIVGGWFTTFNGIARSKIARLNPDGSLDTSFDPGAGFNDYVTALSIQPDGKIIVVGVFTAFNGNAHNRIVRLNPDGSLDTSFDAGIGYDWDVYALSLQPDNKIIVGGNFLSFNGNAHNRIVRLNPDGSLDTTFNPGAGVDNTIVKLALQTDGKILAVGAFTTFDGTGRSYIVRLNPDGSLDTSFDPGSGFGGGSIAYDLVLQTDGKMVVGGEFATFNGTVANRIVRLNVDGSLDTSFDPGSAVSIGFLVHALGIQPDGKIVVGGNFTSFNGTARNKIVRLNTDGEVDIYFDPGTGFNGGIFVFDLFIQADDKIVVGGEFTDFDGTASNKIIRLIVPPTFYVDGATGDDSNSGSSPGTPKKTIQAAVDALPIGGTLTIIGNTLFNEDVIINKNISIKTIGSPSVKSLTIGNGAIVTLQSPLGITGLLKLFGELKSDGKLSLISDANGTAIVDNSGGGTVTGNVVAQRYLDSYSPRSTQGYTYYSSSVKNAKISDFADNVSVVLNPNYDFVTPYSGAFPNVYRYNESKVVPSPASFSIFEKGWESPASLADPLEVMRGYIVNLSTQTKIDFVGELNNGLLTRQITKGNTANSGWHLVGNPYPSPIDWEKIYDYQYMKSGQNLSQKDFIAPYIYRRIAVGQYAGTWTVYVAGVGGLNGATKDIATGQGFFIRVEESLPSGNYELYMDNSMRLTSGNPQFFRTEESEESKTQGVVKVKLSSQKWSDETLIYFKRDASEKYDEGLEVPKSQYNSNPAPNLFTSIGGKRVAFNAQSIENLPKEIPLHFMAASSGQHEISLSELRNFKENTPIYLEDKRLNITQDLREKAYSFTANVGTDTARFVLKFEVAFAKEIPDESLTVYPNPASNELKINIDSKFRGKLQVRLLDMLGREISNQSFDKTFTQEEFKMDLGSLNKGVYFIEIEDSRGKQTKKIVKE